MEERDQNQAFLAWVNREEQIIAFRETEGFEEFIFRSQEDKMSYVYNLCESGYRIQ